VELESEGSGSLLNDSIFGKFEALCGAFDVRPDPRVLAGVLPSVRSALGNSSERLLALYGKAAVTAGTTCPRRGRLLAYASGSDFRAEIKRLRHATQELRDIEGVNGQDGSLAKAVARLAGAQEVAAGGRGPTPAQLAKVAAAAQKVREIETALVAGRHVLDNGPRDLSERFFVTEGHVRDLASKTKDAPISYPDSVSVFERAICIAEHKLSGETDSKNTPKNVEALAHQAAMFSHLERPVEAAFVLPCAKGESVKSRWQRCIDKHRGAWSEVAVFVCEEVWDPLFGVGSATTREYDLFLDRLATLGSDRLFHCFAPPGVALGAPGNWIDDRSGDLTGPDTGPPGRTWLVEVPAGTDQDTVDALLSLLDECGATVIVE
jgi:hypothetical protein